MSAQTHVGSDTTVARVVMIHAGAAPGSNTNCFTALTPSDHASAWRMQIAVATGGIIDLRVTDGTTAYSQSLFDGAALTAGRLYTCQFLVSSTSSLSGTTALTYSIRLQTDSVIQTLIIDEVQGGSV